MTSKFLGVIIRVIPRNLNIKEGKTDYLKKQFPRLKVTGLQIYMGMLSVVTEVEPTSQELIEIEEVIDNFVYVEPPQYLSPEEALEIVKRIQKDINATGVISEETLAQVEEMTGKYAI